jgi:cytochrome b561
MTMASAPGLQADLESHRYAIRSYSMTAKVLHWFTVALVVFMVTSAVVAKQLNDGPWSDTLFMLHKTTGLITLTVVVLRLCYRIMQWWREPQPVAHGRPVLHWLLYAMVILVPLLGWAGISAFGSLEIMPGFTVPGIWPKNGNQADLIFMVHAYLAFTLLALVALHIGVAMQDYMMRANDPDCPD